MTGVLSGVRVLDLSWGVAGPAAAMLLCTHGAEVTRIERPGEDPFAGWLDYRVYHRGKRSAVLDLAARIAAALGDRSVEAHLLVAAAKKDPEDESNVTAGDVARLGAALLLLALYVLYAIKLWRLVAPYLVSSRQVYRVAYRAAPPAGWGRRGASPAPRAKPTRAAGRRRSSR